MVELWKQIESMFNKSDKNVQIIYHNVVSEDELKVQLDKVLTSIMENTAGVAIDNWIRILGHSGENHLGVISVNELCKENSFFKGLLIVAYDAVGGVFAINLERFEEGRGNVWYFAPDTLEWEDFEMNYSEFIAWTVQGDTDEFYADMRWKDWKKDCSILEFGKAYLIYPFLWAEECIIEEAVKKVVPLEELVNLNVENALIM